MWWLLIKAVAPVLRGLLPVVLLGVGLQIAGVPVVSTFIEPLFAWAQNLVLNTLWSWFGF